VYKNAPDNQLELDMMLGVKGADEHRQLMTACATDFHQLMKPFSLISMVAAIFVNIFNFAYGTTRDENYCYAFLVSYLVFVASIVGSVFRSRCMPSRLEELVEALNARSGKSNYRWYVNREEFPFRKFRCELCWYPPMAAIVLVTDGTPYQ
jgi:hypothetical protein